MKFIFFPVSENGENGLGDEGADGGNAPQNFWARTAPNNALRMTYLYTPCLKKLCQCYFLNNSVKHWPMLIIFGKQHQEETLRKRL